MTVGPFDWCQKDLLAGSHNFQPLWCFFSDCCILMAKVTAAEESSWGEVKQLEPTQRHNMQQ